MDVWIWVIPAGVAAVLVAGAWWKRRARREYVINHVRVEMHPARVIEDRVIEQVWRAAISMTNTSRRPRVLPILAERATVRAGARVYLASVYLDADEAEINPGGVALAWVVFALPPSVNPCRLQVVDLRKSRSMLFRAIVREHSPVDCCASAERLTSAALR